MRAAAYAGQGVLGAKAEAPLACSLEADLSESICFCISAAASCASSASCVARVGIEGMCQDGRDVW